MFSLPFRLNLAISAVFIIIFLTAGLLLVEETRETVTDDMETKARLAARLLQSTLETARVSQSIANPQAWAEAEKSLADLLSVLATEHGLGATLDIGSAPAMQLFPPAGLDGAAPDWFVRLVAPPLVQIRSQLYSGGVPSGQLVVSADPGTEISEAWEELKATILIFFAMAATANVLVFIVVGWSLKPLKTINAAFREVERGDYSFRLQPAGLPELDLLATGFNQMAGRLQESASENRELTRRSLEIQEQERRHLARELHDEMGQSISAIRALAASIDTGPGQNSAAQSARTIGEISNQVYDTVRNMMGRLRPSVLDELGLLRTLEQLVDDWNEHHEDFFCRLAIHGDCDDLPEQHGITVYRLVQEALTNVAKHAGPTDVEVRLTVFETPLRRLVLEIGDSGRGMPMEAKTTGLGLRGMQERVSALNGRFDRVSAVGDGVKLNIELPLAEV